MAMILRHELKCELDGCIVTLHINPQSSEFSEELDRSNPTDNKSFIELIQDYISKQFPEEKIKLVKIMIGSVVIASMSFSGVAAAEVTSPTYSQTAFTNYTVAAGDSLWTISSRFGVPISEIKIANNLTTDAILAGQILKIPQKLTSTQPSTSYTTYKVLSGDSLYLIAKRFNTTVTAIKGLNNMTTETLYIGQQLKIPAVVSTPAPTAGTISYTVVSGDSLWALSVRYKTTIDELKRLNSLTADTLYIGQVLKVPAAAAPPTSTQAPTITYITHKVVAGDNPWTISLKYGIPMAEFLSINGFTQSTMLQINQEVKVAVHNVPIRPTPGAQYGERLDWWTEAQYIFPINKTAKITDFATGRTFNIQRTIGANHADSEPLTANDAAIMKQIWGGEYSWTTRAVIVEVDGRRIAGSIASMPHSIEYILDNDFTGHFDLHFLNSTRHKDGLIDPSHQAQINIAAGYVQK